MQQQDHHDELMAVRKGSKTNQVEKWPEINKLCRLLRMLHLHNEAAALKVMCPVYKAMSLAPRAFKMGELQDDINTKIITHRKKYTAVVLTMRTSLTSPSLRLCRVSDDSVTLCQAKFLLGLAPIPSPVKPNLIGLYSAGTNKTQWIRV